MSRIDTSKLKPIGFWRPDPGQGRPIPSVGGAALPDAHEAIDPTWDPGERYMVTTYLTHRGTVCASYRGSSACRICGKSNGGSELTDGVYLWPSGLAHYVIDHDVRLPAEFVEHVRTHIQGPDRRRTVQSDQPDANRRSAVQPSVRTAILSHAEVFSDGVVFFIAEITPAGCKPYTGTWEIRNYGNQLPGPPGRQRAADTIDAAFHDTTEWRRVELAGWPDDELCARYEADATLVCVYEWIGPPHRMHDQSRST